MSGGALGDPETSHPGLRGELGLNEIFHELANATELRFRGTTLNGDVIAILVDQAFAGDDDAMLFPFENLADVFNEFFAAEGNLRQIN